MSQDADKLCANCAEPNPIRAKFCLECGTPFAVDELGERRVLTVLFADIAGFTAFSEGSDVEDVHALAQEAADRLSEIVDRYGGTVDKIIGDCVMAVWGAPVTHEDDAERAVRAALDMQAVVASRSERFFGLSLSTGLYTGEAIWAPIGPDGRYTALGDTVNTAARLQGAAGKGDIYVGAETYHATADVIEYEDVEPVKAKNKAEPVLTWNAVGVKGARRAAHELPMVGRHAEMARLWEMWELVRAERVPYLAAVTGAPGIGKSRLIRGLSARLESASRILTGRCLDYGEGITYWPVIEMVKSAAGILHDDDVTAASMKLGELLEELGSENLDELRTMAVAMANLIAAPMTPRGTYTATEITQGELHWGIRRVFQLLARRQALTLIFEDLHWAEPALISLVSSFVEIAEDAPIFVIGSARPELDVQTLTAGRNTRHLALDVLSSNDSHALVAQMLGTETVTDGPLVELLERAAGNPLFLEETIRMLVEAGALDDEGHIIADKVSSLTIPSSLRALIAARLDASLIGNQKRTAGRASVVGEIFWSGAITYMEGDAAKEAAASVGELEVDRTLAELEDHDVVSAKSTSGIAGQREWAFRHALIRDVVYARIPKRQRVALHARCGQWMAALPGGTDELVEIVAHHLERSCLLARELARSDVAPPVIDAVRMLRRAAAKAESRQSTNEALNFYSRALALLDGAFPETSLEIRTARARARTGLGDYQGAYEEMQVIAEEAGAAGRTDLRFNAVLTLAETDLLMGRVSESREQLVEAERLATALDDPKLRIRAIWQRAIFHQVTGAASGGADDLRAAIALAEEIEDDEGIITGRLRLGVFLYNAGNLAGAEAELERAAALAQEQGSLRRLSWLTFYLGALRVHRGPRAQAATDLKNAVEWLERTGDRYMHIFALLWEAKLHLINDDVRAAVRLLRIAFPLARDLAGPTVVNVARALAEAFARQGRVAEAREIAAVARERAPEEDIEAQANAQIAEGFVAFAEKDETVALERMSAAVARFEELAQPAEIGEALLSEAQVLSGFGNAVAASERLERAREIFEEIGGTATVETIDGMLQATAPPDAVVRTLRRSG